MSGTEDTRAALGDKISYAQSWEDPAVLLSALNVGPSDDVLSICASGDNSFALAIAGARSVTAIDLSAPQIALARLKLAAAKVLDVARFRSFLGVGDIGQRVFCTTRFGPNLMKKRARFGTIEKRGFEKALLAVGSLSGTCLLFVHVCCHWSIVARLLST